MNTELSRELILPDFNDSGKDLIIEDLGKINLFVGKNPVLLEFAMSLSKWYYTKHWEFLKSYGQTQLSLKDYLEKEEESWRKSPKCPFEICENYYRNGRVWVLDRFEIKKEWEYIFLETKCKKNFCNINYTQSIDVIRAFTEVAREQKDETDIRLFRIVQREENILLYKSTIDGLEFAIEKNWETR